MLSFREPTGYTDALYGTVPLPANIDASPAFDAFVLFYGMGLLFGASDGPDRAGLLAKETGFAQIRVNMVGD